jgi:hypothetical protein
MPKHGTVCANCCQHHELSVGLFRKSAACLPKQGNSVVPTQGPTVETLRQNEPVHTGDLPDILYLYASGLYASVDCSARIDASHVTAGNDTGASTCVLLRAYKLSNPSAKN